MANSLPLVVVFGGAGYIGSVLTRQLLAEGYRVRVFDNLLFGSDGIDDIDNPLFSFIEGDICDIKAVSSAVKGAESVILLAAIVGHRVRDVRWDNSRNINYLATNVVLEAAIEHGAHRFIFASTNSVYGVQSGVMYETGIPEPVSLYSRLKLRMEEKIINAKRSFFHPTALRLATCHGYSPRMRFDLVTNTLTRDAVCRQEIVVESGEQWRAFIHVEDAASAFTSCLKSHENLISGEIFNVGAADQNMTINQVANTVKSIVPDCNTVVLDADPDLIDYRLSCSKIQKILGFNAKWSMEDSVKQMKEVIQSGKFSDPYSLKYLNT